MWSQLASLAAQVSETVAPVAEEFREALREDSAEAVTSIEREENNSEGNWLSKVVSGVTEFTEALRESDDDEVEVQHEYKKQPQQQKEEEEEEEEKNPNELHQVGATNTTEGNPTPLEQTNVDDLSNFSRESTVPFDENDEERHVIDSEQQVHVSSRPASLWSVVSSVKGVLDEFQEPRNDDSPSEPVEYGRDFEDIEMETEVLDESGRSNLPKKEAGVSVPQSSDKDGWSLETRKTESETPERVFSVPSSASSANETMFPDVDDADKGEKLFSNASAADSEFVEVQTDLSTNDTVRSIQPHSEGTSRFENIFQLNDPEEVISTNENVTMEVSPFSTTTKVSENEIAFDTEKTNLDSVSHSILPSMLSETENFTIHGEAHDPIGLLHIMDKSSNDVASEVDMNETAPILIDSRLREVYVETQFKSSDFAHAAAPDVLQLGQNDDETFTEKTQQRRTTRKTKAVDRIDTVDSKNDRGLDVHKNREDLIVTDKEDQDQTLVDNRQELSRTKKREDSDHQVAVDVKAVGNSSTPSETIISLSEQSSASNDVKRLERLEEENERLRELIAERSVEYEKKQESSSKQIENERSSRKEFEMLVIKLEQELKEAQVKISTDLATRTSLDEDLKRRMNGEIETILNEAKSREGNLLKDIQSLTIELDTAKNELQKEKSSSQALVTKAQEKEKLMQHDLDRSKSRMTDFEIERQRIQASFEKYAQDLRNEASHKDSELFNVKKQLERLLNVEQDLEFALRENSEFRKRLESHADKKELDEALEEVILIRNEAERISSVHLQRIQALEAELEATKSDAVSLAKDNGSLATELDKVKKTLLRTTEELARMETTHRQKIISLRTELVKAKDEHEQMLTAAVEKQDSLRQDIMKLKEELASATAASAASDSFKAASSSRSLVSSSEESNMIDLRIVNQLVLAFIKRGREGGEQGRKEVVETMARVLKWTDEQRNEVINGTSLVTPSEIVSRGIERLLSSNSNSTGPTRSAVTSVNALQSPRGNKKKPTLTTEIAAKRLEKESFEEIFVREFLGKESTIEKKNIPIKTVLMQPATPLSSRSVQISHGDSQTKISAAHGPIVEEQSEIVSSVNDTPIVEDYELSQETRINYQIQKPISLSETVNKEST